MCVCVCVKVGEHEAGNISTCNSGCVAADVGTIDLHCTCPQAIDGMQSDFNISTPASKWLTIEYQLELTDTYPSDYNCMK